MTIGYVLQKKFNLDVQTLSKLNIYVFVPGFIFVKLYESQFTASFFVNVFFFFVLYILFLFLVSYIAGVLAGFTGSEEVTFTNSIVFFHSGTYGVQVNALVCQGDSDAVAI